MLALRTRIAANSKSLTANSPSRLALRNDLAQQLGYFFDVVMRDRPVFAERRLEQIMQFAIGAKPIVVRVFNRGQKRAQFLAGRLGRLTISSPAASTARSRRRPTASLISALAEKNR